MNLNNNKFLLSTAQPFEQPVDDKPFEILDTTSKSTASSPLHIGFETTRMEENMKEYAGTNFDGQELGLDSKNQKPSQFSNVYINNSIALNFTSNNIMSHHDAPNMAKKIKVTSSYTNTQKPQTEQYETRICLNCGEKNSMLQDGCCPACHSSVTAPSKGFNSVTPVQHDQHMRKEPWSNYVNLVGSEKNENLRISQSKFNPPALTPNYGPNSYHFLPQNSQALIHPQVQANRNNQQGPPNNFSPFTDKDSGEYVRRNGLQGEDFYNAKQNNFDQGKNFEPIINNRIPPPPPPKNSPTKVYEGPNYCDQEASLSFKDELFGAAKHDTGDQKKGVSKEMLDKLDEMSFEGGDAFSFQNGEQNDDDDLDDMDGWQEMDFAGPEESSQEKPAITPAVEEKRGVSLAKKKVEVIELSEHDSDKSSAESPKSSGLRRLLSKEDQKLFVTERKEDEQPVDDLISFFIENSSKKTMLFQKEPLANAQPFLVTGEDCLKTVTEENGDSKGKDVSYLSLIRSKSETQSIPKGVRIDNKKAQNVHKAGEVDNIQKEHKEEGQKGSKLDVVISQKGVSEGLLTSILNQIEEHSNSSLLSAEKTEQVVQSLLNNQTKAAANKGEKKPFVIHNKPRDKSVAAVKLGINLQKTSGSFKKKRQEKEKEKDLEREKERELNWEREHEKEREKLKELERQREIKEKEKEEKHKHRKEHHKENHKEKEHKENHKEKDKEVHKEIHKEKEQKENHKEKELHKEKEKEKEKEPHKEKEKDREPLKEKVKEKEFQKEKVKEKLKEKETKKVEAKMVEEAASEVSSEESDYFMFGDEYDMILECYSQESQFVDVHEVKRRMDDFDFHMKDKEEIENIDEVLYPKKTIICIGGEFQTRIPTILEKNPFGKRAVCKIWDADRIQRQNYEHFMESLSDITKLAPANINEEKAVEILIDNNYSVDQALRFVNQYLDYVKPLIIYPQPPKKQEKEK